MYLYNKDISKHKLAEEACDIEINKLKEPVGKQDQFIASYGGIKIFKIDKKGKVNVSNLNINQKIKKLENNLLLFYRIYQALFFNFEKTRC